MPCIIIIFNYNLFIFYSKGTTDSQQLHKAQQTVTIKLYSLLSDIIIFIGNVDSSRVYFWRSKPITCSTCILTLDSLRAKSTSSFLFFFPLKMNSAIKTRQWRHSHKVILVIIKYISKTKYYRSITCGVIIYHTHSIIYESTNVAYFLTMYINLYL